VAGICTAKLIKKGDGLAEELGHGMAHEARTKGSAWKKRPQNQCQQNKVNT
jgi:hypothetical protein